MKLKEATNSANTFRVMTYNILADEYASSFMFSYVHSNILSFKYRSPRVMREIKEANPEIICLQEVDHYEDWYGPQLKELGYSCIMNYRRSDDATVIAFKDESFTLITLEKINYNDLAMILKDPDMRKHNTGLIATLRHIPSG